MSRFDSKIEENEAQIESSNEKLQDKISSEAKDKFKHLFIDDYAENENIENQEVEQSQIDVKKAIDKLFADDYSQDVKQDNQLDTKDVQENEQEQVDLTKQYSPNTKIEINGKTYDTDDNGYIYKVDGYELLSNSEYTIDGVTYKTDDQGRIISCVGNATSTPEGERDNKAQAIAGGEDRKPGDQGGHILARIFGGAKGIENMLAMRGTAINQSVYKRMENEIGKAIEEGKDVHVNVDVEYEGDSQRPSKIRVTYTIDGKETVVEYDNDEGSTDLLDSLDDKISESDSQDLKDEIQDANDDGANMSVIAVKVEYDEDGNVTKVTVTIRDENGEPKPMNEDRVYEPKEAA